MPKQVRRRDLIRPVPTYCSSVESIAHLHWELGRLGLDVEHNLKPYQLDIYRDLVDGVDEQAVSWLSHFWYYSPEFMARVLERPELFLGETPAKARIDLTMELTAPGNLRLTWEPRGWGSRDCDWGSWVMLTHRRRGFDTRPSNELLFIHRVDFARMRLTLRDRPDRADADRFTIDSILLHALYQLTRELKARLELSFDVRMVTDIYWSGGDGPAFEIGSVAERERQAELELLKQLLAAVPLDVLLPIIAASNAKKKTGPAPSPRTLRRRLSDALKKAGHPQMTEGRVEEYLELLKQYRPEVLPPELRPKVMPKPTATVVPFKKPTAE